MAVAPTLAAMSAHMAQAHYFPCRKCTSVFVSADRLAAHDRGNHPVDETTPTPQGKQASHRMQLMVQLAKETPAALPQLVSKPLVSSMTFLVQPRGDKTQVIAPTSSFAGVSSLSPVESVTSNQAPVTKPAQSFSLVASDPNSASVALGNLPVLRSSSTTETASSASQGSQDGLSSSHSQSERLRTFRTTAAGTPIRMLRRRSTTTSTAAKPVSLSQQASTAAKSQKPKRVSKSQAEVLTAGPQLTMLKPWIKPFQSNVRYSPLKSFAVSSVSQGSKDVSSTTEAMLLFGYPAVGTPIKVIRHGPSTTSTLAKPVLPMQTRESSKNAIVAQSANQSSKDDSSTISSEAEVLPIAAGTASKPVLPMQTRESSKNSIVAQSANQSSKDDSSTISSEAEVLPIVAGTAAKPVSPMRSHEIISDHSYCQGIEDDSSTSSTKPAELEVKDPEPLLTLAKPILFTVPSFTLKSTAEKSASSRPKVVSTKSKAVLTPAGTQLRVWKSLVPTLPSTETPSPSCGEIVSRIKHSAPAVGLLDPTAPYEYKMVRQGEGYVMMKVPKGTLEADKQALRMAKAELKMAQKLPLLPSDSSRPRRNTLKRGPYICKICEKICKSRVLLGEHELTHSTERNFRCTEYPGCTYAGGKNSSALKKHILAVHQSSHSVACEICGKVLRGGGYALRKHQAQIHFGPRPRYTGLCPVCDKMLCTNRALIDHLLEHENGRHFRCANCPKRFNTRKAIASHMTSHMTERPFPCDQCNFMFKNKNSLKMHQRRHAQPKNFKCDECGEAFAFFKLLYSHQRRLKHKNKK